jgi:hypothetical protein
MRFKPRLMQVCIFYQKNYNHIVQRLVVVAGCLQYSFFLLFSIFIFLFFENQFLAARPAVIRPYKSFSGAGGYIFTHP